jgi:hypothetical protein
LRVWDLDPKVLCMTHLSGEHRELHGIWSIIKNNKKGYSKHPETLRWYGKLDALKIRHDKIVTEIKNRNPNSKHKTDLPWVGDCKSQNKLVDSVEDQINNIRNKKCRCEL